MNLREEWLPYKYIIGKVILDKNPSIETVVNKTDTIDTKFRTFQMEVLAGKDDFIVTQVWLLVNFQQLRFALLMNLF